MPFEQFLSQEDIDTFRQAIGDVASGTFGQRDVTLVRRVATEDVVYGGSPSYVETPVALKTLALEPGGEADEDTPRVDVDYSVALLFSIDYLAEEGITELLTPDEDRKLQWELDGIRFRQVKAMWDGQFVDNYTLVFVYLEDMNT